MVTSTATALDIIGDVHGCARELEALLGRLGYELNGGVLTHPTGRRCLFVGDIVDRGPHIAEVLCLVHRAVHDGVAELIIGNHDDKVRRALRGNPVKSSYGYLRSVEQLHQAFAIRLDALAELPETAPTPGNAELLWQLLQAHHDNPLPAAAFSVDALAEHAFPRQRPCSSLERCAHTCPCHSLAISRDELQKSMAQWTSSALEPFWAQAARQCLIDFLDSRPCALELDEGHLIVGHAGFPPEPYSPKQLRPFCLVGDVDHHSCDERGLPLRRDWSARYHGSAYIVHGHVTVDEAQWKNRVIDIDTACVFGGNLTALRWPERELVSVPSSVCLPRDLV